MAKLPHIDPLELLGASRTQHDFSPLLNYIESGNPEGVEIPFGPLRLLVGRNKLKGSRGEALIFDDLENVDGSPVSRQFLQDLLDGLEATARDSGFEDAYANVVINPALRRLLEIRGYSPTDYQGMVKKLR